MPPVGCWGSSNKPQTPGLYFPLNMGCKKPEFYEISFLILIYVLSSEAAQQDYVCVCDCVCTLCVCMCHGVGCHYTVLQYKPRVISADTHNPAFRSTSPNLVSVPGLGGRGPRPGWDEYQTSPGRSEGPFLPLKEHRPLE